MMSGPPSSHTTKTELLALRDRSIMIVFCLLIHT